MIDFKDSIIIESMIYDQLEKHNIKDCEELGQCELELHEIISNVCCDYAYDEKIEEYTSYF